LSRPNPRHEGSAFEAKELRAPLSLIVQEVFAASHLLDQVLSSENGSKWHHGFHRFREICRFQWFRNNHLDSVQKFVEHAVEAIFQNYQNSNINQNQYQYHSMQPETT